MYLSAAIMKYAIASNSGVFSHSFPDKLESYLTGSRHTWDRLKAGEL